MVVGSIPAGGTIDVKRRSAERRFFVDAAPGSGGRLIPILQEFEASDLRFRFSRKNFKKGGCVVGETSV